jgi:hypothetical protein
MSVDNPLWVAPRIHGELLKLGFEVAQSSIAKYIPTRSLADCITVMSEFEFSVHTRLNITLFLLLARQRAFNPLLPMPRPGPFIADISINN